MKQWPISQRRRRRTAPVRRPNRRSGCCLGTVLATVVLALAACIVLWGVYRVALLGREPVNILLLGLDRRPQEAGPSRSDVTMLLRLDPRQDTLRLLSMPRDLYVWIPGYGEERINAAHFWGEWQATGGGPALAAQTIRQNFGVPVDGYLRLDFQGFVGLVDALGGVYIEVPAEIRDDFFPTDDYGYTRIFIPAGRQKMDGQTALIYVRTRHASSDLDRARRQQQVVTALLRRAASPASWLRLPAALRVVRASVDTDLGLDDLLLWSVFALRSDLDAAGRVVLDETMTFPATTPDGNLVLVPDWQRILPLMRDFGR